jgi:hypothetical protein
MDQAAEPIEIGARRLGIEEKAVDDRGRAVEREIESHLSSRVSEGILLLPA